MTHQEIIELFLTYIGQSLDEVSPIYYGLGYWNGAALNIDHILGAPPSLTKYLKRYHERVFCYELYHILRSKMELHEGINSDIFRERNIFLQSEVKKDKIDSFIELMNRVIRLSKEYMPDFILHTPGGFDNQLIVIEVKSNPKTSLKDIKSDLLKIQEFILRYRYEQGVFIAANIPEARWIRLFHEIQNWIPQNIFVGNRIKIFFQSTPDVARQEFNLA